jgi:hypothetical protein
MSVIQSHKKRSARTAIAIAIAAAAAAGCGGEQKPVESPQGGDEPRSDGPSPGLGVSAEIGAMDEEATQRTFQKAAPKLSRCFTAGLKRVPYLGGEVRLALRVNQDGQARAAYVKDSTLGDRETEDCMLAVVKSATWPKPVGGVEGLAENAFTFDPSPDERAPVDWSADRIGEALEKARAPLTTCRKEASAGPLKATLYVDTDGKAVAVGVSGSDDRSEAAAKCVVETLRGITYPSPGSYDAKVSITID